MPQALDRCTSELMKKWKGDPGSRPAKRKEGQTDEEMAFAICTAGLKKANALSLELMLEGGNGPALIGAAATNRPYIPRLKETQVIEVDGKKKLKVHLANPGFFAHPLGPFTLNDAVFLTMAHNFKGNVVGQKIAYDCRHKPDDGAHGWFEELTLEDRGFYGIVDPTPIGLQRAENREFLYSSMEFKRNFSRDDVVLDLERASDDVCWFDYMEGATMSDETVTLEQQVADLQAKLQAEENARKAAEALAQSRAEEAFRLEVQAVDSSAQAVLTLASGYKDAMGNGYPKPLIEWLSAVIRLGEIGEGEGVVRLSEDVQPDLAVRRYLVAAAQKLVGILPGMVPLERTTSSGTNGQSQDFDYEEEWK